MRSKKPGAPKRKETRAPNSATVQKKSIKCTGNEHKTRRRTAEARAPQPCRGGAGRGGLVQMPRASREDGCVDEERLHIALRDIQLPSGGVQNHCVSGPALEELRCKAYVGPAAALFPPDGRPDKSRLRETRLEVSGHSATAEVELGVPEPREPWALRVKLYRRPASSLFAQEKISELVEDVGREGKAIQRVRREALPCRCTAQLHSESSARPGSAQVEVEVAEAFATPCAAAGARLGRGACGQVLAQAVDAGGIEAADVEATTYEKLMHETVDIVDCEYGSVKVGSEAKQPQRCKRLPGLASRELRKLLFKSKRAVSGRSSAAPQLRSLQLRPAVVEKLLEAGVHATLAAARAAEQAKEEQMARALFTKAEGTSKAEVLLSRAVEERMPFVAEQLLKEDAAALQGLGEDAARKAHAAGAWTVLAALLDRGDPMPVPPRLLLDYALRAGHAGLARSCLAHLGEDTKDMDLALRTCLDHGRTEIVREALEVMWKARSNEHSEGPPLLELVDGVNGEHPAECSVCFEELYTNPGIFVNEHGFRVCGHFTCLNCAEHVQDEAGERFRAWRARRADEEKSWLGLKEGRLLPFLPGREPRIPRPPGPVRLTDPTVDPKAFFRLACVPEDPKEARAENLVLKEKWALGTLAALLPVNVSSFTGSFQELWPAWCGGKKEGLLEKDFLRPGGMLAWLSSHLLEQKVNSQLGQPPSLECAEAWFGFFDFQSSGRLTKSELLRGVVKAFDVSQLAAPGTPSRRARSAGVYKLRDLVGAIWDDTRWADGVPLEDFVGAGGLAERLRAALPERPLSSLATAKEAGARVPGPGLSVEEALQRARASDFQTLQEDEARAKERAEKQRQPVATPSPHGREREPGSRPGNGQVLLASLLEAAREEGRLGATRQIRIQCPFCGVVNGARASERHRVICGACRSVFAVPSLGSRR
ncbi:unnamed protein product [Symbiodinium pilosum]|uniref:Uncharacterized protein n=1 Tax=Symbiodinium pilosum TaxID=2952 RepID=A0A812QZI9_SYMPI|nr:unnamed protein product [Symbiodinium pilosum]